MIVKLEIEFLGMIFWPGKVCVGTRVSGAGNSSFTMEQTMFQDERHVGKAACTMVAIDPDTGKSTKLTADLRKILKL